MKKLLLVWLFSGSLDGFSQAAHGYKRPDFRIDTVYTKPDTLCEYMHLSVRHNGFVISRKALTVRVNGICVQHLQSNGRPFPVHYKVGWCEGREELLNRLVNERRNRNKW